MKTVLYIDAANLIMTSKNFNIKYDIYVLLSILKYKYSLDYCYYFTAKFQEDGNVYDILKKAGVEIVFKDLYNQNQKLKANCDVEITQKIILDILYDRVDKVILLSGDGDFNSLLKFAESKNKKVKVIGVHPKTTSYLYKRFDRFEISYVSEMVKNISSKRKTLIELDVSTSGLFDRDIIANSNILSTSICSVCGQEIIIKNK